MQSTVVNGSKSGNAKRQRNRPQWLRRIAGTRGTVAFAELPTHAKRENPRRRAGILVCVALVCLAAVHLPGAPQDDTDLPDAARPQRMERTVALQPGDVKVTIEIQAPRTLRPPGNLYIELPAKSLTATVRTPDGQTLTEASAAPDRFTWKDLSSGPDASSHANNAREHSILIRFFDFFPAGVYRVEIRGSMDEAGTAKAELYLGVDQDRLHEELIRELTCLIVHKPLNVPPGVRDRVLDFVLKEEEAKAIFDVLITIRGVSKPNVRVRLERPDGTYLDENSPATASEGFGWEKAPIAYEEDTTPFSFALEPALLFFPQEGMHAVFYLDTAPVGRYRIHIGTQGAEGRATIRALFLPVARLYEGDRCPARSELHEPSKQRRGPQ